MVTVDAELLASAVDHCFHGVTVAEIREKDSPMIYINKAFANMTGYAAGEVVGKDCRLLQGEETDRGTVQQIREAINRREPVEVTLLNYRKNGEKFWNRLAMSPIKGHADDREYYVGLQLDVTVPKQMEAQIEGIREKMDANLQSKEEGLKNAVAILEDSIQQNLKDTIEHIEFLRPHLQEVDDYLKLYFEHVHQATRELDGIISALGNLLRSNQYDLIAQMHRGVEE